ncbi:hypothetical protein [Acidisphaera sp. S103]|nr:hypothetical protein [Acidisphaera sp. S103]
MGHAIAIIDGPSRWRTAGAILAQLNYLKDLGGNVLEPMSEDTKAPGVA